MKTQAGFAGRGRVAQGAHGEETFVTLTVADMLCGIPVLSVQDVLLAPAIAKIPLAPAEVSGSLNLRGRIVTAIDLRRRIGLEEADSDLRQTSVVVESRGEFYSLMVDSVGDVLTLDSEDREALPSTLAPSLREFATSVYQLDSGLLSVLDVAALTAITGAAGEA